MKPALPIALALGLLWAAGAARADVWGYIDEKGTAHFSAEKEDERYQLFFRGGESFDTREGVPSVKQAPAAAPSAGSTRLLAYFASSRGFQQATPQLRAAAAEHGLDLELLQALVAAESGFDPQAVSPKGAIGLMQVLPATAERYGLTGDRKKPLAQKLTDPITNIRVGARYLHDLIRLFPGRLELALAAYNAGEAAVQKAGNRIPQFRETQDYVKTVMQLYSLLKPTALAVERVPTRVRMELPGRRDDAAALGLDGGAPLGGARGRGNLPAGLAPLAGADPLAAQ